MNILGLIEKLLNREDGRVQINHEFCVRLKTPMAGCYECIDRCPDLSIKITDSAINIFENCSNCNACIYICPNSVFYVKNDLAREQTNKSMPDNNVYFFCHKTESRLKTPENKIKCAYEIDDLDIISFIKRKIKIFFIAEECKKCKLKYFHDKKIKRIFEIKEFFNSGDAFEEIEINNFDYARFVKEQSRTHFGKSSNNAQDKKENEENKSLRGEEGEDCEDGKLKAEYIGRRDFFKNSMQTLKNNAKKIIEDISIEDLPLSELYSEYIAPKSQGEKKINKLLIERQRKLYRFAKENKGLLPLLKIRLPKLNENCVFCSNCWDLCPTGALAFKEGKIMLEPFLCTGCNLCKDICSFGAVRMYKAKNLNDISGKKVLLEQSEEEI